MEKVPKAKYATKKKRFGYNLYERIITSNSSGPARILVRHFVVW